MHYLRDFVFILSAVLKDNISVSYSDLDLLPIMCSLKFVNIILQYRKRVELLNMLVNELREE